MLNIKKTAVNFCQMRSNISKFKAITAYFEFFARFLSFHDLNELILSKFAQNVEGQKINYCNEHKEITYLINIFAKNLSSFVS